MRSMAKPMLEEVSAINFFGMLGRLCNPCEELGSLGRVQKRQK